MAIAKGDVFAPPQHIASYAEESLGRLAADRHLRGLGRDEFVTKLAGYHGDINAAHPFREGNGRAQRAFFGQLAHDAGYDQMGPHRPDPQHRRVHRCAPWRRSAPARAARRRHHQGW